MSDITINEYTDNLSTREVQRTSLGRVDIYKTSVGSMDNNCYFLVDQRAPHESLLIDAAGDAQHLLDVAKTLGIRITTIATTHSHGDHIHALAELKQLWSVNGVRHVTSELDLPAIFEQSGVDADEVLRQGDTISFGDGIVLDAIICRGHTKGGVCFALAAAADTTGTDTATSDLPTHIFVGDCLFPGGIGGTSTPDEFASLISDVTDRIFAKYPDETIIHPGHGNDTTLGEERPKLDQWRERGW